MISVDCGIKAVSFARKAAASGVEVIITDHHRPGDEIPRASAILNPVLSDSGYPFRGLAGVGVVFKLLQALLTTAGKAAALPITRSSWPSARSPMWRSFAAKTGSSSRRDSAGSGMSRTGA